MENLESVMRLSRDLAVGAATLTGEEARFLVDAYYMMQDQRIRSANQIRSLSESGEPHAVLDWLLTQSDTMEKQVKRALARYAESNPLGEWALAQKGIGPVITAGLLAHIDLEKAVTAGAIWRYAGLDPSMVWNKGEKRPWNASLKTLCWKMGESFVKVSGHADAFYGQLYKQRKEQELRNNEEGQFALQAKMILEKKKIGKTTDAYKAYSNEQLPPAHLHARAKRYAVKIFLAHWHEVGYKLMGREVPVPYAIAHQGHAHRIAPPKF